MPRRSPDSLDALLREAMADAAGRAAQDIARAIAGMVAEAIAVRLEADAGGSRRGARGRPGRAPSGRTRRPPPRELTRWAADRRARRVPTFVIELTGLDTKKKIVARYGEGAAFEQGKPAPRARG
jgi:hypothetical protein